MTTAEITGRAEFPVANTGCRPAPRTFLRPPHPFARPTAIDTTRTPDISRRTCETGFQTAFGAERNLPSVETSVEHSFLHFVPGTRTFAVQPHFSFQLSGFQLFLRPLPDVETSARHSSRQIITRPGQSLSNRKFSFGFSYCPGSRVAQATRLPFSVPRRKHTLSRRRGKHPMARSHCRPYCSDMSTLLIIVLLLVLFGGGGGYYYYRRR
jgi:hypothetical protein